MSTLISLTIIVTLLALAFIIIYQIQSKKFPNTDEYNYQRFSGKQILKKPDEAPKPGSLFPQFSVENIYGKKVGNNLFTGKWVILESGSITCPLYAANVKKMNAMQKSFPNMKFVVLYVREAHPGEHINRHQNFENKKACAIGLKYQMNEERDILVDDIEGQLHKKLGSDSNFVYVINPEGMIVYRSAYNNPIEIEKILIKRDPNIIFEKKTYTPKLHPLIGIKVLCKAGILAVGDAILTLPAYWRH